MKNKIQAIILSLLNVVSSYPSNMTISCTQAKAQYQHDTCCADPQNSFNVTDLIENSICVHDSKNWSSHRNLHASLTDQEDLQFGAHTHPDVHQFTDCVHSNAQGTKLTYKSGGSYTIEVNGTNVTKPEHASVNAHPPQCLSSVIAYNVPTKEILSIDYEHLLEHAKIHVVRHRDTDENETNIDNIFFDNSSFIEVILSKDVCRRHDWKYANVFTGDLKGCYKLEDNYEQKFYNGSILINYHVIGVEDCFTGLARNHAPVANNGSTFSLTRMIDANGNLLHRDRSFARNVENKFVRVGTCKCLPDCIFAYEICHIDNPQCEGVCGQHAVDEHEMNKKRGIATRSTQTLHFTPIISQHVLERTLSIGPLSCTFSAGIVIQSMVSVHLNYGISWTTAYFNILGFDKYLGLSLYNPVLSGSITEHQNVMIPDVGTSFDLEFLGSTLTLVAGANIYFGADLTFNFGVDFYHAGDANGVPASTLNPNPYPWLGPMGLHAWGSPLPFELLDTAIKDRIRTYQQLNNQISDSALALNNFQDVNIMRFNLQAQGNVEFGLVVKVAGSFDIVVVSGSILAGVMAGAVLQLQIDVSIVQTIWAASGQLGTPTESACVRFVLGLIVGTYINFNGNVIAPAPAFHNVYQKQWGNNCGIPPAMDTTAQLSLVENVISSA